MKTLDTTYKLYKPQEAEKVVKELSEGDPDWTYKVVHDPSGKGYSFIEVYDEDNNFVEKL